MNSSDMLPGEGLSDMACSGTSKRFFRRAPFRTHTLKRPRSISVSPITDDVDLVENHANAALSHREGLLRRLPVSAMIAHAQESVERVPRQM